MVGARRLTSRRLRSPRKGRTAKGGRIQDSKKVRRGTPCRRVVFDFGGAEGIPRRRKSGQGADDPGAMPPPRAGAEDHANGMAPDLFDRFHKIGAKILTVRISARPSRDNADGGSLPKKRTAEGVLKKRGVFAPRFSVSNSPLL